uniref:tRNA(Ile)-lysidine synthase n=1 Tax=Timspurckia oligopyrenoides TaxID=708627 RepID=UPI001FCD579C|nr:tRNA(Ile)-lysidine synthase [Timspurckia oligopyrenoides]UNJ17593.1 tRNA(Ile)-lysidine synthase [Timspurckia oligopyrenoides]
MNKNDSAYNVNFVESIIENNLSNSWFKMRKYRTGTFTQHGQDSIVLLKLLHDYCSDYNLKVTVIHFDHNWRPDSKINAELIGYLAIHFHFSYYCFSYSKKNYSEEAARRWRYKLSLRIAKQLHYTSILTAHTLTDRLETLLYNLFRGSGLDGLACIAPILFGNKDICLIRPLRNIDRSNIYYLCRKLLLPIWTDYTNFDIARARNKIRSELIPYVMSSFNPSLYQELSSFLSIVTNDIEYLQLKTCFFYRLILHPHRCALNKTALKQLHPCLQKRLLKLFLSKNNCYDISVLHMNRILIDTAIYPELIFINKKYSIYVSKNWVYIMKNINKTQFEYQL